jgi:hypothetical protein
LARRETRTPGFDKIAKRFCAKPSLKKHHPGKPKRSWTNLAAKSRSVFQDDVLYYLWMPFSKNHTRLCRRPRKPFFQLRQLLFKSKNQKQNRGPARAIWPSHPPVLSGLFHLPKI